MRPLLCLLLATAATAGTSCGGGDDDERPPTPDTAIVRDADNAKTTIVVGSKNFTEQKVLGELYAQGLAAAGYKVSTRLNLGDERIARRALERGVIDGYPEYTSTVLLSFCGVEPQDVPAEADRAFEGARRCLRRTRLDAFSPTPFQSSNEVGVKRQVARRLKLRTISDLRSVDQRFTLYGAPECERRQDCLAGLERVYGLRFKRFVAVPIDQRHDVLRRTDVASIVFTTDPQISREAITLLEDDRDLTPPGNSTFVIRADVARGAGPDLQKVVTKVQEGLTDEVMQELNGDVDIDGATPRAAAAAYLRSAGLVAPAG